MKTFAKTFDELITSAKREQCKAGSFGYLPDIISCLNDMRESLDGKLPKASTRSRMVGALGRILTEDMTFAEGKLGTKILAVTEKYAQLPDSPRSGRRGP